MNSFSIVGVLTKDPRPVGEGEHRGARMRLAEAGAHPGHPLYIDASVFGPRAETCLAHLRKGSLVAVAGRLRFREWQGVDLSRRSEHSLTAERIDFLSTAARGREEDGAPAPAGSAAAPTPQA